MKILLILLSTCVSLHAAFDFDDMAFLQQQNSLAVSNATVIGAIFWVKSDYKVYKDNGVTLASNGDTVAQWNDFTGLGNNATSPDAAVYNTGMISNLPAITFSDASTLTIMSLIQSQPLVVYMVVLVTNVGPVSGFSLFANSGGSTLQSTWSLAAGVNTVNLNAGGSTITATVSAGKYELITLILNGASSSIQTNGVQAASGNVGTDGMNGSFTQGTTSLTYTLTEWIVCTNTMGLSATTTYLKNRYGL